MLINSDHNYTATFVIHGGSLESKGMLLAASLAKNFLPQKIVARVMEPFSLWGDLSNEAKKLLDQFGVDVRPAFNDIDSTYPHGNKLSALIGIEGPAIFFDSDIILTVPFSWHYSLNADISAKAADMDTFEKGGGSWHQAWSTFGLSKPPRTIFASVSGELMAPYYNAGVIAVKDADCFGRMWLDCARRIDNNDLVRNKRPWLDQIALPIAISLLGWKVRELPESMNYPCHLAEIFENIPYIAHYHWPHVIYNSIFLLRQIKDLVDHNPLLKCILNKDDTWKDVMDKVSSL